MTIPATIPIQLAALQASTVAAQPLETAPASQTVALVMQGETFLASLNAALLATGSPLDADEPTGHPLAMIAAAQSLATAAADQSTLSDMRGFVGRAVLNLAQAGT